MKKYLLILILLLTSSCFRAQYSNFHTINGVNLASDPIANSVRKTGWQPFFIFGLVPGVRVVDANVKCDGAENITVIQTRRTFGQILMNLLVPPLIFTPWSGSVYCSNANMPGSVPSKSNVVATSLSTNAPTNTEQSIEAEIDSAKDRLDTLKKAKEEGIITDREYKAKRKAVVDSM